MEQNKMVRKYYTPEQKVKIIREHLENQVPLSELSLRYRVHIPFPRKMLLHFSWALERPLPLEKTAL